MRGALLVLAMPGLALPALAHADIDAKGLHVGTNVNGIEADRSDFQSGDDNFDSPFPTPGLVIGAYIRKQLTRTFSMQFEGHVEQKRAQRINCEASPCTEIAEIGLWYLATPVMLRFDLLPGATKLHLHGGPELVLSLGGEETDLMTDGSTRIDDLAAGNIGLAAGTGIEFAAGPGSITVDLRYKRWLLPIAEDGDDEVVLTHQIWLVTGYVFP